jgi:hypothetical protein
MMMQHEGTTMRWTMTGWVMMAATLMLVAGPAGCRFESVDRSAEENQERTGWQDRGRNPGSYDVDRGWQPDTAGQPGGHAWQYGLHYEDVILSPDGRLLLGMVPVPGPDQGWDAPGLVLVAQALPLGPKVVFKAQRDLRRINFSPDGRFAYLLAADGRSLSRLDLDTLQVAPLADLGDAYTTLDVTPGGRWAIASNLPDSDMDEAFFLADRCIGWQGEDRCTLAVVDAATGQAVTHSFASPLRDLDFSPVHRDLVLTTSTWDEDGQPVATLTFLSPESHQIVAAVDFPNCADELKLQPSGTLALLAPTRCQARQGGSADPISVIDLASRTFVENLPGFGPVEISADGAQAVGFTRRADMWTQWGYDQVEEVGLIVVDLPSLSWQVIEYGDREPGYYLAGSGRWLYAYESTQDCRWRDRAAGYVCEDQRELARFDLHAGGQRVALEGPVVALHRFALSHGGERLWALDDGKLVRIDVGSPSTHHVPLPVEPELINVRPQQDYLVLGEADAPRFYLAPLASPYDVITVDLGL